MLSTASTHGCESESGPQDQQDTDRLIRISDIRALFKLGRTAAYELTRRPGFPVPVRISNRCLRWWASEVNAYARTLQREGTQPKVRRPQPERVNNLPETGRRITGTVRAARSRQGRT